MFQNKIEYNNLPNLDRVDAKARAELGVQGGEILTTFELFAVPLAGFKHFLA